MADKEKKLPSPLAIGGMVIALLVLGLLYRNYRSRQLQGSGTACKNNLKNVAMALEMYSTDWGGAFPEDLSPLMPKYLREIPICPPAGTATYVNGYKIDGEGYQLYCAGENHLPIHIPANYPQYLSTTGLIERPDP